MTRLVGSIDNAFHNKEMYHLVFLTNSVIAFPLMTKKELTHEIMDEAKSLPHHANPLLMGSASVDLSKRMANARIDAISKNVSRGKEIEANIDSKLNELPRTFTEIDYSNIVSVEISKGGLFRQPHLVFNLRSEKLAYDLTPRNSGPDGKLDDDLYSGYVGVLNEALPGRLKE